MAWAAAILAAASGGLVVWVALRAMVASTEAHLRGLRRGRADVATTVGAWFAALPVPHFWKRRWPAREMELRLVRAGIPWQAQGFYGFSWVALWLSLAMGATLLMVGSATLLEFFLSLASLVVGVIGPEALVRLRAEQRRQAVERALPDFLDRLTLGLQSGLGFEVALRRASAKFRSVLGSELRRSVRLLDLGRTKAAVLEELAERAPSADVRGFAASVKQSERLGTSLAQTLRVQGKILRARRRRRAQEASRRLPVLVVFPLVVFFLPALLIIYLAPPLLHLFLR